MKQKVVTFGEIMLRLAPEGYYRFVQADTFGATYGGEGLLACAEGGTEVAEHLHRVRHPQAYRELAIYSYRG